MSITIGNVPFTLREAQHHGYKIYETSFSNGTKGFILEASFDDPYVLKEVRYSRPLQQLSGGGRAVPFQNICLAFINQQLFLDRKGVNEPELI